MTKELGKITGMANTHGGNLMDISKMDKAEVFRRLYNRARAQGLGWLDFEHGPIEYEEAKSLVESHNHFDYVKGRVMKVNLTGPDLDTRLYNRDNGAGAAEEALKDLL